MLSFYGHPNTNEISKVSSDKGDTEEVRLRSGSHGTSHTEVSLFQEAREWQFRLFSDLTTSNGEEMTINDEAGRTVKFSQDKDIYTVVGKVRYRNINIHIQWYEREIPNYRTRDFTYGQDNEEKSFLANFDLVHSFTNSIDLHIRSSWHDWELTNDYFPVFPLPLRPITGIMKGASGPARWSL